MFEMLMQYKLHIAILALVLVALVVYYKMRMEKFTQGVRDDINDEYIQWVFGKPAFARPS